MRDAPFLFWALGALAALLILALCWRALRWLLGFALRAGLGGGVLAALGLLSEPLGLHLGVNLFNVSMIGLLGAPGLGLLLLLNWLLE
jgi:inhibitor of the pro-sigma K processing machinery